MCFQDLHEMQPTSFWFDLEFIKGQPVLYCCFTSELRCINGVDEVGKMSEVDEVNEVSEVGEVGKVDQVGEVVRLVG